MGKKKVLRGRKGYEELGPKRTKINKDRAEGKIKVGIAKDEFGKQRKERTSWKRKERIVSKTGALPGPGILKSS